MPPRDFSDLSKWGVDNSNDPAQPVNKQIPAVLMQYLAKPGNNYKIKQIYKETEGVICQDLQGQGWRNELKLVADGLKMILPPGQDPTKDMYIIDDNIDPALSKFGPENNRWVITSWKVTTDKTRKLFIDEITWESIKGDDLSPFVSSHQWRIY